MNLIDGLVLLVLLVWAILSFRVLYRRKKSGKCVGCGGCDANCGGCRR